MDVEEPLRIVTSDDEIQVFSDAKLKWSVPISSLVFVGEYTTNAGPADDYFLEFAALKDGQWTWSFVTASANGSYEAIVELGNRLGQPLHLELVNSVSCKSRAMWPPEWAGRTYRRMLPYKNFLDVLVRTVNLRGRDYVLTDEAMNYVSEQAKKQTLEGRCLLPDRRITD